MQFMIEMFYVSLTEWKISNKYRISVQVLKKREN